MWLGSVSALLWLVAGCSGINSTGSVSPATWFLPGLMKADPPPPPPLERVLPAEEPETQVARL